jgi:H+/Cl- antiporter ClcA
VSARWRPRKPKPRAPDQQATEPQEPQSPDNAPQQTAGNGVRKLALAAGLGAVIGLPAAALAATFLALVHTIEGWLWHDLPTTLGATSPPWYLVLGLPVVGAAIVVVARKFLPGDGGHPPTGGLSLAPLPLRHIPGTALAALGSLPFGAVLGPEGR